MKNRIDSSRQKTPWDDKNNITVIQNFIKEKYKNNFKIKHPKLINTKEAEILNSIKIEKCRYCNSNNICKKGFTNNKVQRYLCKDCHKQFTSTTGTIFENHKISISEWIEYLLDIFNYGSTTLTSKVNKNSMNTSVYWLYKVFLVLRNYQDNVVLSGTIYLDELYYKVIKSDIDLKDGKQFRGISHNQYCIALAKDKDNIIAFVVGLGKPKKDRIDELFKNHIEPKSKIIHDDEKSHKNLVKNLELESESYSSSWLKNKKDKDNPLRPINHQCDLIRQFLNTHSGFDRVYLQDYLNLYCFMNSGNRNKLEKVNQFLVIALTTKVDNTKYRDVFETKHN